VEARYPSDASALEFEETLDAQGIRYESRGSGGSEWRSILVYLLPFLLFMGFWVFLMRRSQEKGRESRRGDSEGEPKAPDPYR
jgi:cell division protease FtsH